jgi:hypothetical protein
VRTKQKAEDKAWRDLKRALDKSGVQYLHLESGTLEVSLVDRVGLGKTINELRNRLIRVYRNCSPLVNPGKP